MKEQFIPYELALELKEIGFDEECFRYYSSDSKLQSMMSIGFRLEDLNKGTLAPLWQQAFEFCLKNLEGYTLEHDSDWDGHVQKPCGDGFTFSSKDECLEGLIELIKDKI